MSQIGRKGAVPNRQNSLGLGAKLPAKLFIASMFIYILAASLEGELTDMVA